MISHMFIDVVDACNLECTSCIRGLGVLPNTSSKIDLNLFKRLIAKAKKDSISNVHLYNWTEPFIHPELHTFVREVKAHDMKCWISSNLALRTIPNLIDTLRNNLDNLIVSVSGFSQEVQSIYHRRSKISNIFNNLEILAKEHQANPFSTRITVRYLVFDHNKHEIDKFRDYTSSLGFRFDTLTGNLATASQGTSLKDYENNLLRSFVDNSHLMSKNRLNFKEHLCRVSQQCITVDLSGNVFLCCAHPNLEMLKIGDFLTLDINTIFYLINTHPCCTVCAESRVPITEQDIRALEPFLPSTK